MEKKNNYNVDLLNANNYHTWKFRMTTLLREKDVVGWISKDFNEADYTDNATKEKAQKEDNLCKSIIVQCIHDSQIDLVRDKSTAYGMWKSLGDRYEKKGIPGQLVLRRKLISMKLKEQENMETFLAEFDEIIRQLRATGAEMGEKDIVCNLLLAMPKSFETVVMILENTPVETLTLDVAKAKLRAEVERRKATGAANSKELEMKPTAFMGKSGACYLCGKNGHFQRNCPKLKRNMPNNYLNQRGDSYHRYGRGRGRNTGFRGRYMKRYEGDDNCEKQGNYVREENNEDQRGGICFISNSIEHKNNICDNNDLTFCVDSGCTNHLVNEKDYFYELVMLNNPIKIAVAKNNNYMEAIGVGNIKVISQVQGKGVECTIKNAFYVPTLRRNLLSVKKLEMANIKVVFENGKVSLYNKGNLIGIGERGNLYEISFKSKRIESLNVESENKLVKLWHNRYGHICNSNLRKLVKNKMVDGIDKLEINEVELCESCIKGKMTRLRFGTRTKAKRILEIIHSDVAGPMTPVSHSGEKYFVTFVDDFSNFIHVYMIKRKSDVFECFKNFAIMVQAKFNSKIATLRCDNGREYVSHEFREFCKANGTQLDYTIPYTPEQNGKAERFNRSLVDKARAMTHEANMPKTFWNEAVRVAAYILNRSPSAGNVGDEVPARIWYDKKPNISNMRVYGSMAYAHIPKEMRKKFDSKAEECIMIGYGTTGYRLWSIERQKVIVARDVVFQENKFYYKNNAASIELRNEYEADEKDDESESEERPRHEEEENEIIREVQEEDEAIQEAQEEDEAVQEVQEEDETVRDIQVEEKSRKGRTIRLPKRYNDYEMHMAFDAMSFIQQVPNRIEELKNRGDEEYWRDAMKKEIQQIEKNETWKEVRMQEDVEILNTRWVFASKPLEKNVQDRFKARLVVRGFAQRDSFDYDEVYSPVAKMSTIRTLLAIGNQFKYYFKQLDVKTAFLNGELKENIYIYPPEGVKCGKGLEIYYSREEGILKIDQKRYLKGILKRFNMDQCYSCLTPIEPRLNINPEKGNKEHEPVRELIGCLMYLMLGTRPDISFAVNYFSRFQDKNSSEVWTHLKRLLRYLKGTIDYELIYKRNAGALPLVCYVDSDWAQDVHDRKSISGYLIKVFGNTVSWVTRKQSCVALSSTEAELVALCIAVQDGLWVKRLLKDMRVKVPVFKVFEDNQACISLIKNPENNKRVRHIDLKYSYISDGVKKGNIVIEYIGTKLQLADMLTKGLSRTKLKSSFNEIGLHAREGE